MSSPQLTAATAPVLGIQHTCIAESRAVLRWNIERVQSAKLSTTYSAWHVDTPGCPKSDAAFSPLAVPAPLLTSGSPNLLCADWRRGPADEEASRRQGDIFPAVVLPDSLKARRRSLALSARCNSTASGLFMMAFTSHQHALEMNCGSTASSSLSYWAAVVPRGSHVREFAPYLIHLSICDSNPSPQPLYRASRWVEVFVRVLLLGNKKFSLFGYRRHAHRVMWTFTHPA
jgi:hypothetical protein